MTSLDMEALKALVREQASRVLRTFLRAHGEAPTALGFVFELYNVTPQLDLCAHLGALPDDLEARWNSGDYDFPAGLTGARRELGPVVIQQLTELHRLAREEPERGAIYVGLVALCSDVLLDVCEEAQLGPDLDLNVSEVGDGVEVVAARHVALSARRAERRRARGDITTE